MTNPSPEGWTDGAGKKARTYSPRKRGVGLGALGVLVVAALLAGLVTAVLIFRHDLPLIWAVPAYGLSGAVLAMVILAGNWFINR